MGKKNFHKYHFKEELIEGLIIKRINRFIIIVDIDSIEYKCYCPSTGSIGKILF